MDLETLVTHRHGFGIESATLLQRAICRIIDGAPLDDLLARGSDTERRQVEAMIGCDPSALPNVPPRTVVLGAPVRTFKTVLGAALSIRAVRTVDVSPIKPGQESPRYSALSTSLDSARTFRGHLGAVAASPVLRLLLVGEDADGIVMRHPSGMPMPIKCVAASRGGLSIASRFSSGVDFSEAPSWYGTDKIVSLEESMDMALGRLLGGAQILAEGSLWQPSGWVYDAFAEHHGKPSADIVTMRPVMVDGVTPAEALNPHYWTPERVEQVRRTSPRTYRMHVLNEWGSAGNSAFSVDELEAVTQESLPDGTLWGDGFCAIDASALRHDSFAAVFAFYAYPSPKPPVKPRIIEHPLQPGQFLSATPTQPEPSDYVEQIPAPVLRVHEVMAFRPPGFKTLDVVAVVAAKCHQYGISVVFADQFEAGSLAGIFSQHGIRFRSWHWDRELKDQAIAGTLRRMVREQRCSLPTHDLLQRQLLSIREIPSAGQTWRYPTGGLDCASALITLAMGIADPEVLGVSIDAHAYVHNSPTTGHRGGRYEVTGR